MHNSIYFEESPSEFLQQRILLIWNDLSNETKINLVDKLYNLPEYPENIRLADFGKRIYELCLKENSSYLRYLGARGYFLSGVSDKRTLETIREDTCELVKYAEYEFNDLPENLEKKFWSLDLHAKLAFIQNEQFIYPQYLANILEEANELHKLANCEVHLITEAYAAKFFTEPYDSYWNPKVYNCFKYEEEMKIERRHKILWETIDKYPHFICSPDPLETSLFLKKIPLSRIDSLNNWWPVTVDSPYLSDLFYRDDFPYRFLRKMVFFNPASGSFLKLAAISRDFNLELDEVVAILDNAADPQLSLSEIANHAADLSWWIIGESIYSEDDYYNGFNKCRLEQLVADPTHKNYREEIFKLGLHRLAQHLAETDNLDERKKILSSTFKDQNVDLADANDKWQIFRRLLEYFCFDTSNPTLFPEFDDSRIALKEFGLISGVEDKDIREWVMDKYERDLWKSARPPYDYLAPSFTQNNLNQKIFNEVIHTNQRVKGIQKTLLELSKKTNKSSFYIKVLLLLYVIKLFYR